MRISAELLLCILILTNLLVLFKYKWNYKKIVNLLKKGFWWRSKRTLIQHSINIKGKIHTLWKKMMPLLGWRQQIHCTVKTFCRRLWSNFTPFIVQLNPFSASLKKKQHFALIFKKISLKIFCLHNTDGCIFRKICHSLCYACNSNFHIF